MVRSLTETEDGAVLPWVALMMTVFLGVTGLFFDLGRHYVVSTELQKAADSAALAGAYQLDPTVDHAKNLERVNRAVAAAADPVTANVAKLSTDAATIQMSSVRLLKSVPDDDDTAIGSGNLADPAGTGEANFVEVTTTTRTSNNVFSRVVGQGPSVTMSRTAVARRGQAVCQPTPLFICNPNTANTAVFDPTQFYGKQVVARLGPGSGAAWGPGNFGFLRTDGSGANVLRDALAGGAVNNCYGTGVETETGQMTGPAAQGFNERFGMNGGTPSDNIHGYPRDQAIRAAQAADNYGIRIGDGFWNCAEYWTSNNLGTTPPAWCKAAMGTTAGTGTDGRSTANPPSSDPANVPSRYNVYRHVAGLPACTSRQSCRPNGSQSPTAGRPTSDRRVITMAVVDCAVENPQGRTDLSPISYLNAFATEPIPTTGSSPDRGDIYLEIIGSSSKENAGAVPVVMREWVEVVR